MKVQVGVISHAPGSMLERCMASLVAHNAGVDYELLLQLTEGSNAENWNRLLDRADCDLLCILEDDTAAIKPLWLASLIQTFEWNQDAGIVMPVETKDGENPDPGFAQWCDHITEVGQTYGFCNIIRPDSGLRADERLTYFVDIDLSFQALSRGYKCYCNGHVWMLHGDPGGGRMSNESKIKAMQAKDSEYLRKKWAQARAA